MQVLYQLSYTPGRQKSRAKRFYSKVRRENLGELMAPPSTKTRVLSQAISNLFVWSSPSRDVEPFGIS